MTKRTIFTTDSLVDTIPQDLPISCLRKDPETDVWTLKRANDQGIKQWKFPGLTGNDAIVTGIRYYTGLPSLEVGSLILCYDGEEYLDLQRSLTWLPDGYGIRGLRHTPEFPWSHEPKRI